MALGHADNPMPIERRNAKAPPFGDGVLANTGSVQALRNTEGATQCGNELIMVHGATNYASGAYLVNASQTLAFRKARGHYARMAQREDDPAASTWVAEVGERLELLRTVADMTQGEMAALIGVDQSTWSKYEAGQKLPSTFRLRVVCGRFKCSFEYLYDGTLIGVHPQLAMELAARDPRLAQRTSSILKDRGMAPF